MSHYTPEPKSPERRHPSIDRRKRTLRALVHGSFRPRRRGPRREGEATLAAVDWHPPQWLAVSILVLILSFADALLTLTLLERGAREANPFMAPLVHGSGWSFGIAKVSLTSFGVILLVLLAHLRVFRIPVAYMLYGVLGIYVSLIIYELWLLELSLAYL